MASHYRIIIIEADVSMQQLISGLLIKAKHEVVGIASNGHDGLELIKWYSPDIVFVDIELPGVKYMELLRQLHTIQPIAVVVISSEECFDIVNESSGTDALAYIVKPPELSMIESSIRIAVAQCNSQIKINNLNKLLAQSIEERKIAENKVVESKESFRMLAENTSDIILQQNCDLQFIYGNAAFEENFDVPVHKIIGKSFESFINDSEKRTYLQSIQSKVLETGIPARFEIVFTNPNRVFDWNMVPEYKNGKLVTTIINTIRNITELRDAQNRLYQLEKMHAIGQLAGGIAHDFNNKLGAILGYADILLDSIDETDIRRKYVEAIIKSSQFASELTSQLLAYARKGKVKNELIDMHNIIDELIRFLNSTLNRKVMIKKNFCSSPAFIIGDPISVKNAFLYVAINANDAMPEGGILSFETAAVAITQNLVLFDNSELPIGSYIRVRISDTGMGINHDVIKRIFEPFFTTKDSGKGTGLGLPAVYGIVKSHSGGINVSSIVSNGTVFDIYFPSASSKDVTQNSDIRLTITNDLATVLVIDDNELIREMAAEILNKLGYNVIVCRNGDEAVKLYGVHSTKIDLVMIDIIMPGMDGYETYKQLKMINPLIKAFFISGYSVNEKVNRFFAEGVLGIIQKPFRISEIKSCLDFTLHKT